MESKTLCGLAALILGCASLCVAGENDIFGGASPILTGAVGFTADVTNRQNLTFGPKFEPIRLLPLGKPSTQPNCP
jgi:hypothetical protein